MVKMMALHCLWAREVNKGKHNLTNWNLFTLCLGLIKQKQLAVQGDASTQTLRGQAPAAASGTRITCISTDVSMETWQREFSK